MIQELVPDLAAFRQLADHIGEREQLVLESEVRLRPSPLHRQVRGVHIGAIDHVGPGRDADEVGRADGVQVEQQLVAAIGQRQNHVIPDRRPLVVVEEGISGLEVVQRADVGIDEISLVERVADRSPVRIQNGAAGLQQRPGLIDDRAEQAAGGLEAEVVVQHPERGARALVRHTGLHQRMNRQQVARISARGDFAVGRALEVGAGDESPGAVREQVDASRRDSGEILPGSRGLIDPETEIVERSLEAVAHPVSDRSLGDVGQRTIQRGIGLGDRHTPVPQRHVKGAVDAGLVRAVDVSGVDQRLDDVGVRLGQRLEYQLAGIDAAREQPLVEHPRHRAVDEGPGKARDEEQRPVDFVLDVGEGHRGPGRARLVHHGVEPIAAVEYQVVGRAAHHNQLIVATRGRDGQRDGEAGVEQEVVGRGAALQVGDRGEVDRDGRTHLRGDRERAAVRATQVPVVDGVRRDERDLHIAPPDNRDDLSLAGDVVSDGAGDRHQPPRVDRYGDPGRRVGRRRPAEVEGEVGARARDREG